MGACTHQYDSDSVRSDVNREIRVTQRHEEGDDMMMTVAFNHKHMTVMYMESALPVFKLNGSEMVHYTERPETPQ